MQHRDGLAPELRAIAALDSQAALRSLKSSEKGLSEDEVLIRRTQYGENKLAHEKKASLMVQLLGRLFNPLVILLVTLAVVSLVMSEAQSAIIILAMVLISITLGLVQERKSGQAAEKLRAMVHTTATVIRVPAAAPQELPIEALVPGDLVHLSAGDMVPADLRLIAAKDLFVNQASLTGEALPVEKHAGAGASETAGVGDLANICLMGTAVVSGSAMGVIVLTGQRAYFGHLAARITGERPLTSFDRGVNRFAWLMIRFILIMAPLVFLINGITKGNWVQALLFATAVAVGLTPEMLPMIVTVNLGKGALAMSRRKVIVKR
ncbi:MAG TPA: cation-transporting P-type ATPase, partial [Steroidobacteraceae bacterium]